MSDTWSTRRPEYLEPIKRPPRLVKAEPIQESKEWLMDEADLEFFRKTNGRKYPADTD
jgi:hypothetical protein